MWQRELLLEGLAADQGEPVPVDDEMRADPDPDGAFAALPPYMRT